MASASKRTLCVQDYVDGVRGGDRATLGQAITLVESNAAADQGKAQDLLLALLPHTGGAHRVGVSGVPGVGKSTFIEALGTNLTSVGKRVAVLAVDPSSGVTGGSILGDKTRMEKLSRDDRAFVRPSPASGSLGGVTRKTRESILVCEAAGFDVVLVETVGVGQSETLVADMVDFFLVLMLAGAGDELQGIKRGILELADLIAINKADGDNKKAAMAAKREYASALKLMRMNHPDWTTPVVTCSAVEGTGLDELWREVEAHHARFVASGALEDRRKEQRRRWMWSMVDDRLAAAFRTHPDVRASVPGLEQDVLEGRITPTMAARTLLERFGIGV